jgi:hypothetical protein
MGSVRKSFWRARMLKSRLRSAGAVGMATVLGSAVLGMMPIVGDRTGDCKTCVGVPA